jgi:hypothetical protein
VVVSQFPLCPLFKEFLRSIHTTGLIGELTPEVHLNG